MKRFGLQTLLLVPLLATLTIGAALLGVFTYQSVKNDQLATLDAELDRVLQQSTGPERAGQRPRDAGEAPPQDDAAEPLVDADNPLQIVLGPSGEVLEVTGRNLLSESHDLSPLLGGSAPLNIYGDERLRAQSVELPNGNTQVVALPLDELDASLSSLRRSLILGGLALVATQALIAALVVNTVKRPISLLRARSHRIASGALDTPLDVQSGPAEVVSLTEDLGAMVGQLRSTIDERERAAEVAEQARADMARFMADVSHELRTPLTAISGYRDLHTNGMLDGEGTDRAMERIGAESDRLTELVNDLLRLLRPTDPKAFEVVDLGAIASAVAHDLRAAEASHTLSISLGDDALHTLGDPARIHQALLNLAANACHHTPEGTSVDIRVYAEPATNSVVVDVVDDGPGFDQDRVDEIVQPFVRLDESRARHEKGGAGLGLTITTRIAEQHDGQLTIESKPGVGTTQ